MTILTPTEHTVTIHLIQKVDVNGDSALPLWKFLKRKQPGPASWITGGKIPWNFTKFLIDRQGNPIDRFAGRLFIDIASLSGH